MKRIYIYIPLIALFILQLPSVQAITHTSSSKKIMSVEELKYELKYFHLKQKLEFDTKVTEIEVEIGGELPDVVKVKKDGAMIIDEKATKKLQRKKRHTRNPPEKETVIRKNVEQTRKIVGGNTDELQKLLKMLFGKYGNNPEAIAIWAYLIERARDKRVKGVIQNKINKAFQEYQVVPIVNNEFKNIPKSKIFSTPEAEFAFFKMILDMKNEIYTFLATTRLFITTSEEIEQNLVTLLNERERTINPLHKALIILILSRSNGKIGEKFLLQLALNDKDWGNFAWEALARRKTKIPNAYINQALNKKYCDSIKLGAVRYIGTMKLTDMATQIMQLGANRRISERLRFNIWLALEEIYGDGNVPYDPTLWSDLTGKKLIKKIPEDEEETEEQEEDYSSQYYNIDLSSRRIAFICDQSLSMKAGERWHQLTENLLGSIHGLESDYKFTVVFYGSRTKSFSRRLVPANSYAKRRFTKFMNHLEPKGEETCTSKGIRTGLNIRNINTAYLLSDGIPYGESITETFNQWIENDPIGKIILHTISIEPNPENGLFQDDFLFFLAQLGWGDFVSVTNKKAKYLISPIWEIKNKKEKLEQKEIPIQPEE